MKNVDLIFDILDQAALIHYENIGIDYLAALSEISNNLNNNEYHNRLNDEIVKKLEFMYKPILEGKFLNEELRLALELFIVKGLKHINYSPNIMTPDFVNYIFSIVINTLFEDLDISIIDTVIGTGNLLATIKNNYPGEVNLIGIENDQRLTSFASSFMDIQQNDIKIYFQDALNKVHDKVDVVIGDLSYHYVSDNLKFEDELYKVGVRYFPYLVISSRLDNIIDDGYFIYLIDNEFFSLDHMGIFKTHLDKSANISGLIVLPKDIVKDNHSGKSIIIGKKTQNKNRELMAVEIKGLDGTSLQNSISKIKTMIKKIKEE